MYEEIFNLTHSKIHTNLNTLRCFPHLQIDKDSEVEIHPLPAGLRGNILVHCS